MDLKSHRKELLIASLVTSLLIFVLNVLDLPWRYLSGSTNNHTFGIVSLVFMSLGFYLLVSMPGMFWLYTKNVKHYIAIPLFAVIEMYFLIFIVSPFLVMNYWWLWACLVFCLPALYVVASVLFNDERISLLGKFVMAIAITVLTAIIAFV